MRRYYPPKVPKGAHTQQFDWLTWEEKAQKVKKLLGSGYRESAVAHLTGLTLEQIRRIAALQ